MTRENGIALCAASVVIAILWVALGSTGAPATAGSKQAAPAVPQSSGTIRVDRVMKESYSDYGEALISYLNTSGRTFTANVTIRCDAFDPAGGKVGTQTGSFFAHEHGPITPGFTGTKQIPVKLNGADLKEMNCWIESAR